MPNIQENITRIQGAKNSLKTSIENKGVTIPDDALIDTYYSYVDQIQTGSSSGGSSDYDSTMEDKHFSINNDNGWPTSMTSATISDGITSLPDNAFLNSGLIEIEIPDSVTSLGGSCFQSCFFLSSITIPDSVISFGWGCFQSCSSLSSITIPTGVTSLSDYCFFGCNSLSSITIPDSMTSLGNSCFQSCSSLSSITIGTGVTSIAMLCFDSCSSLTAITCLPTAPPTSGGGMFDNTNNCPIYVPNDSVEAYKSAWSEYADRIFPIDPEPLPTGSTENADIDVVYDVTSTTSPTLIYSDTPSFTNPYFKPESIDYFTIDDDPTQHEPTSTEYTFDSTGSHTIHYYLTGDTIPECMFRGSSGPIRITDATIGSGTTAIEDQVFARCEVLSSITIPDTVTSLGDNCFSGCTALTSIDIPSGVTSLGDWCFMNCFYLSSVTIPDSVTSIGSYCFKNCDELSSIEIPSGVTELPNDCFLNCTSLSSITIPDSVTSLGNYCFENCSSLSSITIPDSVTSLGENCFDSCTALTSIEIPSGITSISTACFTGCYSLSSITIPDSVTYLWGSCFAFCTSLSSITIPSGVTQLPPQCFQSCTGFTSFEIPSGITSIDLQCFYNCSGLTSITCLPTVPPTSGQSMFNIGAGYTADIYVPDASVEAYKSAWTTYADWIQPLSSKPE